MWPSATRTSTRFAGSSTRGWRRACRSSCSVTSTRPRRSRRSTGWSDGLRDVHAQVGFGTGWTWRPIRLEFLGLGVLRIDHVIVSPDITPIAIDERCPAVGDHCLVQAELRLTAVP